jgi:hypothetical protein
MWIIIAASIALLWESDKLGYFYLGRSVVLCILQGILSVSISTTLLHCIDKLHGYIIRPLRGHS